MVEGNDPPPAVPGGEPASAAATPSEKGVEVVRPEATEERNSIKAMYFRFTADRFGFAEAGDTEYEIEYARDAIKALNRWADTIRYLLSEIDGGLHAAANARILPLSSDWKSTSDARQHVQASLDARSDRAEGDASKSRQPFDQVTRSKVEELRNYLGDLWTWHQAFEAGLWIATIAAQGSIEINPQDRLLHGLRAIAQVCEFKSDDVFQELLGIIARAHSLVSNASGPSPMPDRIAAAIKGTDSLNRDLYAKNSDIDPARLENWAAKLKIDLSPHQHMEILPRDAWAAVETVYWDQWDWPMEGAVKRREDRYPTQSVFDLMMAARYANDTFLNWRGGLLSIAEWSRILAITSAERREMMRIPAQAALSHLGFPEMVDALAGTEKQQSVTPAARPTTRGRDLPPVVALSTLRQDSTLLAWRPDSAVRAVVLRPRDQDDADRRIAHSGLDAASSDSVVLTELVRRCSAESDIVKLYLIEVPQGKTAIDVTAALSRFAATIKWERVYFAEHALTGLEPSLRSSPRDVRELVEDAKREFLTLFSRERIARWQKWYAGGYRKFQSMMKSLGIADWRLVQWLDGLLKPTDRSGT